MTKSRSIGYGKSSRCRGPGGQFASDAPLRETVKVNRKEYGDPEVRRERDRKRKAAERKKQKGLAEKMPAVRPNGGTASRKLKEEAMAELVVVRRCWDCEQAFEAKVKNAECPWCG